MKLSIFLLILSMTKVHDFFWPVKFYLSGENSNFLAFCNDVTFRIEILIYKGS